ncbi:MAG: group 1 glycosyl transferase, partial [bacterium]
AHSEEYVEQLRRDAGPGVILAGTVLGEELTDLYGGARLLVNPTYRDAVSLVLLEAMAQGTPVLASDIPEMLEGLAGTGRHFRTGDVEDLHRQLQGILADDAARESMSARERERVTTVYAWDPVVDQFEVAYRELLA